MEEENEQHFGKIRNIVDKILKKEEANAEEELLNIVQEAEEVGEFNEQEGEIIRNAIGFNSLEAVDILTPRVDVVAIWKNASVEEIQDKIFESGFSRFPVYDEDIDDIVGIINEKDFYKFVIHKKDSPASIIKPVQFVSETIKISKLLKLLQQSKSHMAIVADEYGGTMGIVTLEDILEELVGEIWDEHDKVNPEIEKVSDNEYCVAGGLNLEKFFEFFDIENKFEDITTVSGWIIEQLGRIPEEGEGFSYENLLVTVKKKDFRRIIKVSIKVEIPEIEKENIDKQ